jgi:hypothetical protein
MPLQGSVIPFPRTELEKAHDYDPRDSIEIRYSSKDEYLQKIQIAADFLVKERYILPEDTENVVDGASQRWDAIQSQ